MVVTGKISKNILYGMLLSGVALVSSCGSSEETKLPVSKDVTIEQIVTSPSGWTSNAIKTFGQVEEVSQVSFIYGTKTNYKLSVLLGDNKGQNISLVKNYNISSSDKDEINDSIITNFQKTITILNKLKTNNGYVKVTGVYKSGTLEVYSMCDAAGNIIIPEQALPQNVLVRGKVASVKRLSYSKGGNTFTSNVLELVENDKSSLFVIAPGANTDYSKFAGANIIAAGRSLDAVTYFSDDISFDETASFRFISAANQKKYAKEANSAFGPVAQKLEVAKLKKKLAFAKYSDRYFYSVNDILDMYEKVAIIKKFFAPETEELSAASDELFNEIIAVAEAHKDYDLAAMLYQDFGQGEKAAEFISGKISEIGQNFEYLKAARLASKYGVQSNPDLYNKCIDALLKVGLWRDAEEVMIEANYNLPTMYEKFAESQEELNRERAKHFRGDEVKVRLDVASQTDKNSRLVYLSMTDANTYLTGKILSFKAPGSARLKVDSVFTHTTSWAPKDSVIYVPVIGLEDRK